MDYGGKQMETTVKNVGLAPINRGEVQKYTAKQSPAFKQEFWDRFAQTNDLDYYMYVLNQADSKGIGIDNINFDGLDGNVDDEWAEFYKEVLADNTEIKDYGEDYGEMTEKQYLSKVLDQKREYIAWVKEEEKIAAEKEAMSGWEKFWAGVGHFFVNVGYTIEQSVLSIFDFVTNWDSDGEPAAWLKPWADNLEERKVQLADWERRYSYRDVKTWDTGFGATMLLGAANTLGLMIPAFIANKIHPGAGMYVMYGTRFTNNVYEARNTPDLSVSEGEIILRAILQTGVELLIEQALGPSMLDDMILNAGRAGRQFVKVTTLNGIKILAKEMLHEATEEFLQELGSAMVNMIMGLGNEEWQKFNSENLAQDLGIAALLGGLFAGARIVVPSILTEPVKAIQAATGHLKAGNVIADVPSTLKTKKGSASTEVNTNTEVNTAPVESDTKGKPKATPKPEVETETAPAQSDTSETQQKYHRMNMFERLAMQTNLQTFFDNLNKAAKENKAGQKKNKKGKSFNLDMELREMLHAQAVELGQIFQGMDAGQMQTSMQLLTKVHEYAKTEGVKQERILLGDKLYLEALTQDLDASKKEAMSKYWEQKGKKAAKKLKKARISKANTVIDKDNVQEEIDKLKKEKDAKAKARERVIEDTVKEGIVIVTTDGNELVVEEDMIFIPQKYLENGNPSEILRNTVERDLARQFLEFMNDPKRKLLWTAAKAAIVKAYPELGTKTERIRAARWAALTEDQQKEYKPSKTGKTYVKEVEYSDEDIARNILFTKGGAYALIKNMPNAQFNTLFLNMLQGLKDVVYNTASYKAAQQETIHVLELNFRYAARMYCLDNLGINPHDLHNVLTKVDQMYIKEERAKAEAKLHENMRQIAHTTEAAPHYISEEELFDPQSSQGRTLTQFQETAEKKFDSTDGSKIVDKFGALKEQIKLTLDYLENGSYDVYEAVNDFMESWFEEDFGISNPSDYRAVVEALMQGKPFPAEPFVRVLKAFNLEENGTEDVDPEFVQEYLDPIAEEYNAIQEQVNSLENPMYPLALLEYLHSAIFTGDESGRLGSNNLLDTIITMIEKTPWLFENTKAITAYRGVKIKGNNIESATQFLSDIRKAKVGDTINFKDSGKVMPVSLDVNTARGFTGEAIDGNMSDGILFTIIYEQQNGIMAPMGKGEAELVVKGGLDYKILDVNSDHTQYLLQAIYDTNSQNSIERPDTTPTEKTEEQVLAEAPKQSLMEDDMGDLKGAKFTTPEYEDKTYKDFREYLLKPSLSTLEKDSATLEDVIKNPEAYLKPKILEAIQNEFGDTSENSVYRWLRALFIEDSKGKKTIVRSENGKAYYFADVRSVKKWNTTSVTEKVNNDPNGNSLIEEYKGKTVSAKEFFRGEALIGLAGDTQIEFKEGSGNYYSANQNKIYIDTTSKLVKTNEQFLFAVNHEFQHALQATNRLAGGFTLGLKLPAELVAAVEAEFPERFKKGMTAEQKNKVANRIIYEFSGEFEANLHSTKYRNVDDYPGQFVIAVEGDNYVITTPSGAGPYRVGFKDKVAKSSMANKSAKGSRGVSKKSAKGTNLEYLTEKGKKLRIDPEAKAFIENSRLELLEDDVAAMITSGDLRHKAYQKLMKWFKTTDGMNEYTFQQFKKAFWADSKVDSFKQLVEITTGLTFDLDDKGNWHEVKFRGPNGEEFSINDDAYRRVVMEYWVDEKSTAEIRRIVASTEILRREITFSSLAQTDKEGEVKEFDPAALGDFTEAILNNTTRIKKENYLMKVAHRQILADAAAGKLTLEETRAKLNKFNEDYFGSLTDDQLDEMFLKYNLKAQNLKVKEAAIKKALQRNRKNAVANIKRLGTTIWNNTTPKNRPRLPKKVAQLFTEDGHIKPEAYQGKSQLDIVGLENLLKEVAYKARRGAYATDETVKIFEQLEAMRKKVEDYKAQKNNKTQTVNTTGVVTEYRTNIKTEVKTIQVKTTKANIPQKLEKMLATGFNETRMSNIQEMENFEYQVAQKTVFYNENKEILDSLTEAEWMEIVEWFEQSEFVGTEAELGLYRGIRMYILADLISRIRTHNLVMDNTWANRAKNAVTKNVHGSAVELGVFGQVLDVINPYRTLAEEYSIPEEDLDELEEAFKTGTDEELAKAIDQIKADIAENYVEKGLMEKLLAFRYTAMLSGPMTWFRNVVSNYIVKYFNKLAATIGNKLGAKRLSGYNGYTLVGTKVSSDVAKFIQENLLDTGLLHQLTEGYSKYDPYKASKSTKTDINYIVRTLVENFNKQFEADHLYGDSAMGKLFTKFSQFVRKMISDDKFVNEATLRYFGKMLTEDIEAGRIDAEELSKGMFNKTIIAKFADAQWLAMNDYMKNTNFMTKAMSALNENKFARYIIPIIAPFAQSSWNWWVETMRYSPFGLVQSVTRLLRFEKYQQKMDAQRDSSIKGQSASVQSKMLDKYMVTRNLGKGVIGTFLWTTGIILAATGVMGLSRRNDSYVLTFGGGVIEINLDNVFGSSSLLAGAALVSCIKDGQWTKMLSVTLDQMAKTLFLTDILSTFEYGSVGDYMMSLPFGLLRSFIPSFIKTFSNNVQVYKVKYDSGILGQLERFANDLIPGVSYAFNHEIDPYTGKKRFYKIPILTQFGGISYNHISQVERECIKYGVKAGQFNGEITVDGQKVKLDKTKVMTYKGEYVDQFVTALINDEVAYKGKKYSKMTDEEKASALTSAINKANNYAKIRAWTEAGNKYYAGKDLYLALKSLSIQNVYLGSGGYVKAK